MHKVLTENGIKKLFMLQHGTPVCWTSSSELCYWTIVVQIVKPNTNIKDGLSLNSFF